MTLKVKWKSIWSIVILCSFILVLAGCSFAYDYEHWKRWGDETRFCYVEAYFSGQTIGYLKGWHTAFRYLVSTGEIQASRLDKFEEKLTNRMQSENYIPRMGYVSLHLCNYFKEQVNLYYRIQDNRVLPITAVLDIAAMELYGADRARIDGELEFQQKLFKSIKESNK